MNLSRLSNRLVPWRIPLLLVIAAAFCWEVDQFIPPLVPGWADTIFQRGQANADDSEPSEALPPTARPHLTKASDVPVPADKVSSNGGPDNALDQRTLGSRRKTASELSFDGWRPRSNHVTQTSYAVDPGGGPGGGDGKDKDPGWVGRRPDVPTAPHTGPPAEAAGPGGRDDWVPLPPPRQIEQTGESPKTGTGSALSPKAGPEAVSRHLGTLPELVPDGGAKERLPAGMSKKAGSTTARHAAPPPKTDGDAFTPLPPPREVREEAGGAQVVDRAILLGAARTAVKRGNYDQAISRYEEYFRRFGEDPTLRREYAGVLVSANRISNAAQLYQQLLAQQPDNLEIRVILGDLYVLDKEYRKAVQEYLRALDQAPNNLDIATKLARAYAFNEDMRQALEIYDRFLAGLQPGKENVPRTFGALLLDFQQPAAALPFLQGLRNKYPDDMTILGDLVRCYSRLEDRAKAGEMLDKMGSMAPQTQTPRQVLAESLYRAGDYETADRVYRQILRLDPGNSLAQVGTARVALQNFEPAKAAGILANMKPEPAAERIYWLTWAEYHQLIGEYIQAKQIYADFLRKNGRDHEVHLALAALYDYIAEFDKAKAEYSKVPPDSPLWRKGRLGFASTMFDQRFFEAVIEQCHVLLAEKPDDGSAMALLVRSLAKTGHGDKAVALCRSFFQHNKRHEAALLSVQFALAKIYLDAGKYLDAGREYEILLTRPGGRDVVTYYGLARAAERIGTPEKAGLALATISSLIEGNDRYRLLLADLYAADYDDARTIEMALGSLSLDANNLAALIRLADAQQRQARFSAVIDEAVKTCKTIIAISPTNVRGHLALARALSIGRQYKASAATYQKLMILDSSFGIPPRERARVLFSSHDFGASAAGYQQMQVPPAGEKLRTDLDAYSVREPRIREPLQMLVRSGVSGKALEAEVLRLSALTHAPEIQSDLQAIVADYQASANEQLDAHLEGEEKSRRGFRHKEGVPIDQSLLAAEPSNEEAFFDLAQSYGALTQTRNELNEYAKLLEVNPQHRDAQVAQERANLELGPHIIAGTQLFSQNGRNGLAVINTAKFPLSVLVPWGDENEYFQLGFSRVIYAPPDDKPLDGNIMTVRFQEKLGNPYLLLFTQVNYEQYPDRFHDRPTGEAGAQYYFSDCFQGKARMFLENVVQNGETLRQDIYRFGGDITGNINATRFWQFGGYSRLMYYSDVNTAGETFLYSNYMVSLPPKQLKLVVDMDMLSYAKQTGPFNPNNLIGVLHPYFAPKFFTFYEGRVEWTHWLSRDYFIHSNQCYYSLQYALGFDNSFNSYNTFRALFNFDIRPWLSLGMDATQTLSPVYNASSINAYLVMRFPWRLCSW